MAAKKDAAKVVAPPAPKIVAPPPKKVTAPVVAGPKPPPGPVKILCILQEFWGTEVTVGDDGQRVTISKEDGTLVADPVHAKALLANTGKYVVWSAAASKVPAKRMSFKEANPGVPNAEIRDPRTGRILNDDEALRVLGEGDKKVTQMTSQGPVSAQRAGESADPLVAQAREIAAREPPKNVITPQRGASGDDENLTRDEQIAIEARRIELEKAAAAENAVAGVGAEEPPSADWPEVSMNDTKDALVAVAEKLVKAGVVAAGSMRSKKDVLDLIETGYAKLAAEG